MGRIQRFRGKLLECRLKLFKINKYEFYSSSFTNHWSISLWICPGNADQGSQTYPEGGDPVIAVTLL